MFREGSLVAPSYAVVDVETTGLHPGWHHRIVEVAVVHVDESGGITDEWCTVVNPQRDLGPQHIHGITAAEARRSPRFAEIAGDLAARLVGRMVVGHNVSFDLRFLAAEFGLTGIDVPLGSESALCTMSLSGRYLTPTARSLAMCCEAAGVRLTEAHSALHDARATAQLLGYFLRAAGRPEPWRDQWEDVVHTPWPALPAPSGHEVRRGNAASRTHFLARLVDGLPRISQPPRADQYLAVLDRALLDRHLSDTEQDELVGVARDVGLTLHDVEHLHRQYLIALAERAWADEVVTPSELADLRRVADLLGIGDDEVKQALETARAAGATDERGTDDFHLETGDSVVFTGQTRLPREVWMERAMRAGLGVHNNVIKSTKLVVAADPDTLSGKARKAHTYRIPIITEDAFETFLEKLRTSERA
jgi:DNA polymerase III subunit epsilon